MAASSTRAGERLNSASVRTKTHVRALQSAMGGGGGKGADPRRALISHTRLQSDIGKQRGATSCLPFGSALSKVLGISSSIRDCQEDQLGGYFALLLPHTARASHSFRARAGRGDITRVRFTTSPVGAGCRLSCCEMEPLNWVSPAHVCPTTDALARVTGAKIAGTLPPSSKSVRSQRAKQNGKKWIE